MCGFVLQLPRCCCRGVLVIVPLDVLLLEVAGILDVTKQVVAGSLILSVQCASLALGLVLAFTGKHQVINPLLDAIVIASADITANDDLLDLVRSLLKFFGHDNTRLAEVREELTIVIAPRKVFQVRSFEAGVKVGVPPMLKLLLRGVIGK